MPFLETFKFMKLKQYAIRDIIFVVLFLFILSIPVSNINFLGERSEKENRKLTAYKPFWRKEGCKVNYEYGKDFEKWFNDRFNGREKTITFWRKICKQFNIRNNSSNGLFEQILYGKDDWLFENSNWSFEKQNATVMYYKNLCLFSENELKQTASYLQNINDWCKNNGKNFYYIIVPDKNRIYGEFYPEIIERSGDDRQSRTFQLLNYLKENTDVKVIYPYDFLRAHKEKGLLYFKNDTHWNALGGYYGYRALMNEISKDYDVDILTYQKTKTIQNLEGDIDRSLHYKDEYIVPDIDKEYIQFNPLKAAETKYAWTETYLENKSKRYKIVMFVDSFSQNLLPYLGNTFGKVSVFWRHYEEPGYKMEFKDLEYIKNEADIVILETLERYEGLLANYSFPKENN